MKLKNIRTKLFIAFGILIFLSALMAGFAYYSLLKLQKNADLVGEIDKIHIETQSFLISQKEFLLHESKNPKFYENGQSENYSMAKNKLLVIQQKIRGIKKNLNLSDAKTSNLIASLQLNLNGFLKNYHLLVQKHLKKGFQDWGLQGKLREAIHKVEQSKIPYNKTQMLMLRRHEKDFLLRNNLSYVQKFNDLIKEFQSSLNTPATATLKTQVGIYQKDFNEVVRIEQEIGFQDHEGIKGELKNLYVQINQEVQQLNEFVSDYSQKVQKEIVFTFLIFFGLQLMIALYFGVRFSRRVSKRIILLKSHISEMAKGNRIQTYQSKISDELGLAFDELNQLNQRIASATEFSKKIGQGDLQITYPEQFKKGFLESTLLEMQSQLLMAEKEKNKRNWTAEGLSQSIQVLRNLENNTQQLSKTIIAHVVKYVDAYLGGIFLLNKNESLNDEPFLELKACYAYNKSAFQRKKILIGEGLVGQAFKLEKTVYLNDLPNDYICIESGLGSMNPKFLLIVPLKTNQESIGVLELASFKQFEDYQIEFVEKLAETIAYTILSAQLNQKIEY